MENTNMTNEVMVREDFAPTTMLDSLMNPENNFFCSIEDDGSKKSKIAIYNAINSAEKSIADMIGKTIEIADVVAHPITITDEQTGEIVETLRTVIIDKNGVAYQAVSGGINNSLQKLFSIFGMPSWKKDPVKVEVKQVATRNGVNKVNTLVAVE